MKKILSFIYFISIYLNLFGQEDSIVNKYFMGGTISFSIKNNYAPPTRLLLGLPYGTHSSSTDEFKNTVFNFTPYIGKELNSKLFVGANLGISLAQLKTINSNFTSQPRNIKTNSRILKIGLFFRQIINPSNRLVFYVQPYVGYSFVNENTFLNSDLNEEKVVNYYEIGAGFGIMYDITKKFRTTLRSNGFAYAAGSWKNKDENLTHNFNIFYTNFNLPSLSLGIEYRW